VEGEWVRGAGQIHMWRAQAAAFPAAPRRLPAPPVGGGGVGAWGWPDPHVASPSRCISCCTQEAARAACRWRGSGCVGLARSTCGEPKPLHFSLKNDRMSIGHLCIHTAQNTGLANPVHEQRSEWHGRAGKGAQRGEWRVCSEEGITGWVPLSVWWDSFSVRHFGENALNGCSLVQ